MTWWRSGDAFSWDSHSFPNYENSSALCKQIYPHSSKTTLELNFSFYFAGEMSGAQTHCQLGLGQYISQFAVAVLGTRRPQFKGEV